MLLDEDQLQLIELRAEAIEAMTRLAHLDTLQLITQLRQMRAVAKELRALTGDRVQELAHESRL